MERKLWLSADGKVMLGEQELPRSRTLSVGEPDERSNVRVVFEVEVEKLDVQFQALGLNKECSNPTDD